MEIPLPAFDGLRVRLVKFAAIACLKSGGCSLKSRQLRIILYYTGLLYASGCFQQKYRVGPLPCGSLRGVPRDDQFVEPDAQCRVQIQHRRLQRPLFRRPKQLQAAPQEHAYQQRQYQNREHQLQPAQVAAGPAQGQRHQCMTLEMSHMGRKMPSARISTSTPIATIKIGSMRALRFLMS